MILGHFRRNHRPFVEAFVQINIDAQTAFYGQLEFLLDTGADQTFIMPADGLLALGIDYSKIPAPTKTTSTPYGDVGTSVCSIWVGFDDANQPLTHQYNIDALIYPNIPLFHGRPSAIGRDIFNHWRIIYDFTNSVLEFDVLWATRTVPNP